MKRETKSFCIVSNQLGFAWLELMEFGFTLGFTTGLSDFKFVGFGCGARGVGAVMVVGDGSFV